MVYAGPVTPTSIVRTRVSCTEPTETNWCSGVPTDLQSATGNSDGHGILLGTDVTSAAECQQLCNDYDFSDIIMDRMCCMWHADSAAGNKCYAGIDAVDTGVSEPRDYLASVCTVEEYFPTTTTTTTFSPCERDICFSPDPAVCDKFWPSQCEQTYEPLGMVAYVKEVCAHLCGVCTMPAEIPSPIAITSVECDTPPIEGAWCLLPSQWHSLTGGERYGAKLGTNVNSAALCQSLCNSYDYDDLALFDMCCMWDSETHECFAGFDGENTPWADAKRYHSVHCTVTSVAVDFTTTTTTTTAATTSQGGSVVISQQQTQCGRGTCAGADPGFCGLFRSNNCDYIYKEYGQSVTLSELCPALCGQCEGPLDTSMRTEVICESELMSHSWCSLPEDWATASGDDSGVLLGSSVSSAEDCRILCNTAIDFTPLVLNSMCCMYDSDTQECFAGLGGSRGSLVTNSGDSAAAPRFAGVCSVRSYPIATTTTTTPSTTPAFYCRLSTVDGEFTESTCQTTCPDNVTMRCCMDHLEVCDLANRLPPNMCANLAYPNTNCN
eukprot:UC1_evm3s2151